MPAVVNAMSSIQPSAQQLSHSGPQAGMSGKESTAYWYSRAHRALKQRWADPQQMSREYQHVCALDDAIQAPAGVAKSRAAAGRNRYCNVLPYDFNRVVLGDEAYINASIIRVQLPMLERPCAYIATQGPLPITAGDFWGMVYSLKVPAIVMLTNVNECGVNKCAQYFPAQVGSTSLPGFKLQVEQVVPFSPDCTLRVMRLSSTSSERSHMLCHYHFHAWPDHGTPGSSAGLRAVCRSLSTARESGAPVLVHCSAPCSQGCVFRFCAVCRSLSTARESGAPVLVHCSAGIGRTGTFCAVDILLQRLDAWPGCNGGAGPERGEVEAALNLPALVHELRRQRMGMVQTLEQYAFVYQAIVDDLQARTKQQQQQGGSQ
ncbi:hypothetical protein OEZ85_004802 [Tetradesmus obliquus]|uniref:Uncharacterized protein n=1 Tax=Tetradesmus obliquus TaxID=3088 RepID=A0ABY8UFW0_TETOB|nr:hypothetical protein OEZ85_004802 [Tetradesmus obliquus]